MDLRSRVRRRIGVSAAVAGLAVLLPAMALAATPSVAAVPGRAALGPAAAAPSAVGPAAVGPAAAGPSAAGPAGAPACSDEHTQVWLGLPGGGTAGTTYYQLEFSNIGPTTCTLFGFPGVSAVRANGHQIGPGASRTGRHDSVVTLLPGETGHAVLEVTDAGAVCAHPVRAAGLRVYPPGQTTAQPVPLAIEMCSKRPVLQVRTVHDGTGIPGFTIR
jgi:hypothetical protein